MATPPVVVSPACDAVIRLLMSTHAQYIRAEVALAKGPAVSGRLSVLPSASHGSLIRREGALVRSMTIVEGFTHEHLRQRLELLAPAPRNPLIDPLFKAEEKKSTATWGGVAGAYAKYLNVTFATAFSEWKEFLAVVEARNAIVHGLGHFTKQQRSDQELPKIILRLQALDFQVAANGQQVLTTHAALSNTARLLRRFLEFLDSSP